MIELFRYIEQAFVIPAAANSISVANQSTFQNSLNQAVNQQAPADQIRMLSTGLLSKSFPSPTSNPFALAHTFDTLRAKLLDLKSPDASAISELVRNVFGHGASEVVVSDAFIADRELLDNALVAVKLTTGFDKVNAADLVSLRQSVAFTLDLAAGRIANPKPEDLRDLLGRSIAIPQVFVEALKTKNPDAGGSSSARGSLAPSSVGSQTASAAQLASLQGNYEVAQSIYDYVMALAPQQFELVQASQSVATAAVAHGRVAAITNAADGRAGDLQSQNRYLRIGAAALDGFSAEQKQMITKLGVDPARTSVATVLDAVKRKWVDTARELLPKIVPRAAKVVRVGAHVFAMKDMKVMDAPGGPPVMPDFSHVVTRPVGIGNLQVVRQQLVGYEAGDISHIENVLEGELLRRATRREEVNELTITQETDTTQSEERDQQSTARNELASETQKESGQQSSSVQDQTTSNDYGKLVENSKTNYARTVTDRAVNNLTQMVKQQRVQREKKTFVEKALHELDNRQGAKKVKGIYQWVDKKYKARVVNYGKRLLYDVVVPEPAAFLIDSLKNAVQPESFQLTKPVDPGITPLGLNAANYSYLASQYGVTGTVTPPPDELVQTVAHQDAQEVSGMIDAFGVKTYKDYFGAFTIQVPNNYKAISGYLQRTNPDLSGAAADGRDLEVFIGESTFLRFSPGDINTLNVSFALNGETGDIPVTLRSFPGRVQFNFAIGINCQRTDKAYEQWQLKTHAAVMAGYQRQLADYQDKLAQYTAAVRAQMALAQNFAHDPSIEQQELKKAFISLLVGEHLSVYLPTPDPNLILFFPAYVRDWGAMVAFFERAFEWENIMFTYYPYFWGRPARWSEMVLTQDLDPEFEAFLKAGAARVVIPARPGFEAALAHYQETGEIWMGEEIPDMFSDDYVSIISEIKSRNLSPENEVIVEEWDVKLPTTLVMLKDDTTLPEWTPTPTFTPPPEA